MHPNDYSLKIWVKQFSFCWESWHQGCKTQVLQVKPYNLKMHIWLVVSHGEEIWELKLLDIHKGIKMVPYHTFMNTCTIGVDLLNKWKLRIYPPNSHRERRGGRARNKGRERERILITQMKNTDYNPRYWIVWNIFLKWNLESSSISHLLAKRLEAIILFLILQS